VTAVTAVNPANGCYVCGAALGEPIYTSRGHASMTTMLKLYDESTVVSFCDRCGHLQTKSIVDPADYYAHQYSILANTDDEDLLYKVVDGRKVFQVEHRVATLLQKVPLPPHANVLDYGCAKGAVLRRLKQVRSDVTPHFFDVTDRYLPFWGGQARPSQWAIDVEPAQWNERFDAVCSFYVLEHVADPVATVQRMAKLIKPGGYFYCIVPNALANAADLIVADHLQHYSENSWFETLRRAGLSTVEVDDRSHDSALIAIARKTNEPNESMQLRQPIAELRRRYEAMSAFWSESGTRIRNFEQSTAANREACIYGAGFYGNFIASCLDKPSSVTYFVDQNPHLTGREILGKPIVAPVELAADVEVLYAGLNPAIARGVIEDIPCWRDRTLDVFYL
jgi:2-polyprenyl-3-methyl-5-hydroxy-6-metoxy-1,4-benzoquinol methylase